MYAAIDFPITGEELRLVDVAFAVRERGEWGQGYNTEHLSLLLSGSLRSALPLDMGIEVSWPFFPDRCSTALVR